MPHKVTAPIARSTAYDFNCHLSLCHTKGRGSLASNAIEVKLDEDQNVLPHELLFAIDSAQGSKSQRMRCASSLNGSSLHQDTVTKLNRYVRLVVGADANINTQSGRERVAEHIRDFTDDNQVIQRLNNQLNEHVRYVGVAVTGCTGGAANALQRQGFSASRGGLMTVMNTGNATILPGQRVYMQLHIKDIVNDTPARAEIEGINISKIVPRLRAANDTGQQLIPFLGEHVAQLQILHDVVHHWPLMPYLHELARERFPLRV